MYNKWISITIVLVAIGGPTYVRPQEFLDGTTTEAADFGLPTVTSDLGKDDDTETVRRDCPCLAMNLCPQDLYPLNEKTTNDISLLEPCKDENSIRCCGASSRGFIGMFGDPESATTSTSEDLQNYGLEDIREMESTTDEEAPTTVASIVETHIMKIINEKENMQDRKNINFETPVEAIYTKNVIDLETEEQFKVKEIAKNTDTDLPEPILSSINVFGTTQSPVKIITTTKAKSVSSKYGDIKKRKRFRPSSFLKHNPQSETNVKLEEDTTTRTDMSHPPNTRLGRHNELIPTTTEKTLKLNAPMKNFRLRLFNSENRLNYLRKKQATTQETTEDMNEKATTPQTDVSVKVPTPIPDNHLVSHVDKQHKFMIEQVRFMLAQDTRRYPIVPIHSSFSTMAVAANIPRETAIISENIPVSTETPVTSTTEVARPFRGRKRYRYAEKQTKESATSILSTTEKLVVLSEMKQEIKFRKRQYRTTTISPTVRLNETSDLTAHDELLNTSKPQFKYQRRTRRTNESEVEFPSVSSNAFSSWSEMFPPFWSKPTHIELSSTEVPPLTTFASTELPILTTLASTEQPPSTISAPTFFQSLMTKFLPKPFWGQFSISNQKARETESIILNKTNPTDFKNVYITKLQLPLLNEAKEFVSPKRTSFSTINDSSQSVDKLQYVDPTSKSTPFRTSNDRSWKDATIRNGSIQGVHVESSVSSASKRVEVIAEDDSNFSGLITLNQNLEPWQIIGPIPKFYPPNDADHIEFDLPLETREVVLI